MRDPVGHSRDVFCGERHGELADDPERSAILEQVELGVAVRMPASIC